MSELPPVITAFMKAVYGDYANLSLESFNEVKVLDDAAKLIGELRVTKDQAREGFNAEYAANQALLAEYNKVCAERDSERAAKERLALELARADEERERKASQIGSLEDALSFESAKAARLTKELEEARKPRWQPMETAPTDKPVIGLEPIYMNPRSANPRTRYIVGEMHWVEHRSGTDGNWYWANQDPGDFDGNPGPVYPTAWQPLPEPPALEQLSNEGEAG